MKKISILTVLISSLIGGHSISALNFKALKKKAQEAAKKIDKKKVTELAKKVDQEKLKKAVQKINGKAIKKKIFPKKQASPSKK